MGSSLLELKVSSEQFRSLMLVQVVQESNGNGNLVNDDGLSHGLLQVQLQREPPATCDPAGCTYNNYVKMLQQGVNGHSDTGAPDPPGIAYWLQQNDPGAALRCYNTGHLPDPSDYSVATAKSTQSYVSDIANRLAGLSPKDFPTKEWKQQQCGFQPPSTG